MSRATVVRAITIPEDRMDDRARRDEKDDRAEQRVSRSNGKEERDDSRLRRDPGADRPSLTRRETEDPWPIG